MIIWSGWGFLVIVIAGVVGGPVALAISALLGAAGVTGQPGIGPMLGLFAAAAVTWWAGQRLNGGPGRTLVDSQTGQAVVLRRRHTLFFIPMQWWAVALALFGVMAYFGASLDPGDGPGSRPGASQTRT